MFIYVCIISGLQQELKQSQRRCQQVIKERETELQDLSHAVLSLRVSPLLPGGCEKRDGVGYGLISKRPIMGRKVLQSWTSLLLYVVKQSSAQAAVEDTEKIFSELIQLIEALCFEVTEMIKAKEQKELDEAHGFMEKLEQEIAEFKRRDAEYDTIARLEDKTQFLKVTSALLGQLSTCHL